MQVLPLLARFWGSGNSSKIPALLYFLVIEQNGIQDMRQAETQAEKQDEILTETVENKLISYFCRQDKQGGLC